MHRNLFKTIAAALALALFAPGPRAAADIFEPSTPSRVCVHDPSVVIGYEKDGAVTGVPSDGARKVYYIFGSHRAFARSTDLQNWTPFTNNISTSFASIFADDARWSARGGNQGNAAGYDVSGNLWAPDVVWNPQLNKWCMYMSVNGDYWYSSIVLLTAESLDGDWTRVGPVVYSGFTNAEEAAATDFFRVCGGTELPARYTYNRNGVHTYGMNAIDPCAFFDREGNLWLIYGSWFGGLYMLRLDPATGLRDYSYTYETVDATAVGARSDEYQGIKIAGGNHCSGEAPYIEYIGDRYYLFVTYGGLTAAGGYSMRVFSSENVTGPYTDMAGHPAIYTSSNTSAGDPKKDVGSRLMAYYKYDLLSGGYVAQGHNSAVVDTDGRAFAVYHTRFTNAGEYHEVRVHQLFQTAGGGLVAAPFEYRGESLATGPLSTGEIAGSYRVIMHNGTDYARLACQNEKSLELLPDGTLAGAFTGSWTADDAMPRISLTIGGVTYEGVLIEQQMEGLDHSTLCFSALGSNDIPLWGFRDPAPVIAASVPVKSPVPDERILATHISSGAFNDAEPRPEITEETGLSLGFYVYGLSSDWDEIARSTDGRFTLFLSVLRYAGADFYEALATPNPQGPVQTDLWTAFLNNPWYATVSYNPDGTVEFYRDGTLLFTYATDLAPSWGSGVTPADIARAAVGYYLRDELVFSRQVWNIAVAPAVPCALSGIENISCDSVPADNIARDLLGRPVDDSYRGIVILNGRKVLRR